MLGLLGLFGATRSVPNYRKAGTRHIFLILLVSSIFGILAEEDEECGLYMAESSIPGAGWGVYTGKTLKEGSIMEPQDLSINVADYDENAKGKIKRWLMHEYYWHASVTESEFEADQVNSIIPGFGMLANSHLGLINIDNREPPRDRKPYPRGSPEAGAFTNYHHVPFHVVRDLPAGHELFDDYGNEWFELREEEYGYVPLKHDFRVADQILDKWNSKFDLESSVGADLYPTIRSLASLKGPRILKALPESIQSAIRVAKGRKGTAIETVPNAIRPIDWLQDNGFCIDNIQPKQSTVCEGRGAFATRKLPKGSIVAPAPLIHLHRDHLAMTTKDEAGFEIWSGHQLLYNYVFGHRDTSILLFPYSPAVNYINHGSKGKANVGIRWSDRMMEPSFLNLTVEELVEENTHAGLMLEFYALRDIEKDEEILLDYGGHWEESWDRHTKKWVPPVGTDEIEVAWDYDTLSLKPLSDDDDAPPDYIQTRCMITLSRLRPSDADGWREWAPARGILVEHSLPCEIVSAEMDKSGNTKYYGLVDADREISVKVKGIPPEAIRYVDNEYLNNQFLRTAFRHFIQLPDDMVPQSWKDLGDSTVDQQHCGMYMAESAIPNSGLGMYTAKRIPEGSRAFFDDVIVPAEDIEGNTRIRGWSHRIDGDLNEIEPPWALNEYFWNNFMTNSEFEADDIENMCPGLGMLANSHTSLFNVDFSPPDRVFDYKRSDPSVGASSNSVGHHFLALETIEAGEELYVEYGDDWFEQRKETIGEIPLSTDFAAADEIVHKFDEIVDGNHTSPFARSLWSSIRSLEAHFGDSSKGPIEVHTKILADGTIKRLLKETTEDKRRSLMILIEYISNQSHRLFAALPEHIDEVLEVLQQGSDRYSVPNHTRSIEWLEENGRCLDNIISGRSTITEAGRGAFATRNVREGDVVAPLPMVHVFRKHMIIYDGTDIEDPVGEFWEDGQQLILNYCYSHPESSMLFFPYSPTVNFINHNRTGANCALRWSSLDYHRSDWLKRSPSELENENHAGLIMELVAMRDIKRGEEIFIDYGVQWEKAWDEHRRNWKPLEEDEGYVEHELLNENYAPVQTQEELEDNPYPPNIETECLTTHINVKSDRKKKTRVKEYAFTALPGDPDAAYFPCDVIARYEEEDSFESLHRESSIKPYDEKFDAVVHFPGGEAVVKGIPRAAIQFTDLPYTSDMFIRNAFRHEIHIPDDIFPEAWKDQKKSLSDNSSPK